jgi:hypothetical protein
MASDLPRRFARRAPSKVNPDRFVDIRITDMNAGDALWWDRKFGPSHAQDRRRADRFWAWSVLLPMCHLVQLAKRRYCRPLVIWTRADNRRFVRAGMSILIDDYPHLDIADPSQSDFVWFISAGDSGVLTKELGVSDPPSLGRVLLDCAVVVSENAGFGGRIGLHAAPQGGQRLLDFYVKCGLTNLPKAAGLPPAVTRRNDGRFFFAGAAAAAGLAALLDADR